MSYDTHYEDHVEIVLRLLVAFKFIKRYKKSEHSDYIDRSGVDFGVVRNDDTVILLQVKSIQHDGSASSGIKKFRKRQRDGYVNPIIRIVAFPRNADSRLILNEVLYGLDYIQMSRDDWGKYNRVFEILLESKKIRDFSYATNNVWEVTLPCGKSKFILPELEEVYSVETALPYIEKLL